MYETLLYRIIRETNFCKSVNVLAIFESFYEIHVSITHFLVRSFKLHIK